MLTITSDAFHEKLDVGNEEIILNGPPGNLRGNIFISNKNTDEMKVRSLALIHTKKTLQLAIDKPLRISCRLKPGEERLEQISHSLPSHTPPGTYESSLIVGGKKRMVKMVVQSAIDIQIYPSAFTFQGTQPGKEHLALFTMTNTGNLPFQIPDIKHIAPLDMDFLCGAVGFGFRKKGGEGFTKVMDEVTKNIYDSFIDWAATTVVEKDKIVQPGESMLINLKIGMPKNADAKRDYDGNIRFWDKEITFVIKAHNEKK